VDSVTLRNESTFWLTGTSLPGGRRAVGPRNSSIFNGLSSRKPSFFSHSLRSPPSGDSPPSSPPISSRVPAPGGLITFGDIPGRINPLTETVEELRSSHTRFARSSKNPVLLTLASPAHRRTQFFSHSLRPLIEELSSSHTRFARAQQAIGPSEPACRLGGMSVANPKNANACTGPEFFFDRYFLK
jgi:hypothetical protein